MSSRPQSTTANRVGPLRPTASARRVLHPAGWSRIAGGFWGERRRSPYRGSYPFLDTDVYKWLEAAAWQAADEDAGADSAAGSESEHSSDDAAARIDAMVALIAAAQQPDGYLNSWFQVVKRGERYTDLRWGHELYVAGHLIQAAIALHRSTARADLLRVACGFADQIDATFGRGKAVDGVCGHPEVETALVELYRETGEPRYLSLARYFVERRGHGLTQTPLPPHGARGGSGFIHRCDATGRGEAAKSPTGNRPSRRPAGHHQCACCDGTRTLSSADAGREEGGTPPPPRCRSSATPNA